MQLVVPSLRLVQSRNFLPALKPYSVLKCSYRPDHVSIQTISKAAPSYDAFQIGTQFGITLGTWGNALTVSPVSELRHVSHIDRSRQRSFSAKLKTAAMGDNGSSMRSDMTHSFEVLQRLQPVI